MLVMTARLFHAQKNTESLGCNAQAFIMLQSAKILIQGCKDYGMLEKDTPAKALDASVQAEPTRIKADYCMPFISMENGVGRLRSAVTIGDGIVISGHTFFPGQLGFPGRLGWARVRYAMPPASGKNRPATNTTPINFDVIATGGQGGVGGEKSAWPTSLITDGTLIFNRLDVSYLYSVTYTPAAAANPSASFSVRLQPVSSYSSNWSGP
jgi:hypothetical protein